MCNCLSATHNMVGSKLLGFVFFFLVFFMFLIYLSLHLLCLKLCCVVLWCVYFLWHGGFYILCLLFVIVLWFVLLCLIWRLRKTKRLKYLYLRVCVCVCGKRKNASLTNEWSNSNSNGKLQMLNTTSSRVFVYTILLFCSRPIISLCVQQRECLCGFYVLSVSAYIYILWSLRVFVSIRRRIFPDYFICVCISVCFK